MADKKKPVLLRIDPDTHEALQRWATDELRSVNAQIEYLLRRTRRLVERLAHEALVVGGPGKALDEGRAAVRATAHTPR